MKKISYLDFVQTLLPAEEFLLFKECYQTRLPKSLKIIEHKIKKSEFLSFLKNQWRSFTKADFSGNNKEYDDVLYVSKEDKSSLWSHFLHQGGFFYIQEVAAGLSAQVLNLQKWDLVLDLCAAPWGKSIQIADALLKQWAGFVLSNEPSNSRRKALIFNINRCGIYNTAVSAYRGEQLGTLAAESFDKVLVDAPCSWEGMNYKHDKNTFYRDPRLAQSFSNLQYQILCSGLQAVKVGWEVVYSTCTLNPLENEQVIAKILSTYPGEVELLTVEIDQKNPGLTDYAGKILFTLEESQKLARFRPHRQKTGGFFIAKLRKKASIQITIQQDKRKKEKNWLNSSLELQNQVWSFLSDYRGIPRQEGYSFLTSDTAIYLTNTEHNKLPTSLFIEKIGVPIFKIWATGDRIPQQGLATCLWDFAQEHILDITDQQAEIFNQKSDFSGKFWGEWSFIILKWKWRWFSVWKQVGNRLKNKLY